MELIPHNVFLITEIQQPHRPLGVCMCVCVSVCGCACACVRLGVDTADEFLCKCASEIHPKKKKASEVDKNFFLCKYASEGDQNVSYF